MATELFRNTSHWLGSDRCAWPDQTWSVEPSPHTLFGCCCCGQQCVFCILSALNKNLDSSSSSSLEHLQYSLEFTHWSSPWSWVELSSEQSAFSAGLIINNTTPSSKCTICSNWASESATRDDDDAPELVMVTWWVCWSFSPDRQNSNSVQMGIRDDNKFMANNRTAVSQWTRAPISRGHSKQIPHVIRTNHPRTLKENPGDVEK